MHLPYDYFRRPANAKSVFRSSPTAGSNTGFKSVLCSAPLMEKNQKCLSDTLFVPRSLLRWLADGARQSDGYL